ncbi:MAG: hypothetical protein R6X19_07525, partial [Kiritimatiellia bacterium]
NVSYGMWHNRRWKESGPVVQGRYHAVPVDSEGAWVLEASRYIHLNPVRLTRPGFEDVRRAVEEVKSEKWEAFRERQGDWVRDVALWQARVQTGLTLPEIAKAAGVADHRAAGKAVERTEKRMREERELKQIAAQVMKVLSEVGT